jgi:hypothetical protein
MNTRNLLGGGGEAIYETDGLKIEAPYACEALYLSTRLYGITTHNTTIRIITAVCKSELMQLLLL